MLLNPLLPKAEELEEDPSGVAVTKSIDDIIERNGEYIIPEIVAEKSKRNITEILEMYKVLSSRIIFRLCYWNPV
jgi:hypothetical protein